MHTHKQNCCSILIFHLKRGRKPEELWKYHSNKIFLVLWDPPLLIQHQEKWREKACYRSGPKQTEKRETYFLWGVTKHRMNSATVDRKLLKATGEWATDECKRAEWVTGFSNRVRVCSSGDHTLYVWIHFDQTAMCVTAMWLDRVGVQ